MEVSHGGKLKRWEDDRPSPAEAREHSCPKKYSFLLIKSEEITVFTHYCCAFLFSNMPTASLGCGSERCKKSVKGVGVLTTICKIVSEVQIN